MKHNQSPSMTFHRAVNADMGTPQKAALVFRPGKELSKPVLSAMKFLKERGTTVYLVGEHPLSDSERKKLGVSAVLAWKELRENLPDILIAFGGDGTLLHSLNELQYPSHTLFLGINRGNLGFLTEGEAQEGEALLSAIWNGDYWIDRRFLLDVGLWRNEERIWQGYSLNELLVRQEHMARPLKATLFLDKVEMASIQADGYIVATPTGSTAYALSAGGPIIHPFLNCFEITPVAPHSMNSRSIIVHDKGVATLVLDSTWHCARIYVDGMGKYDLKTNDHVRVHASDRKVSFIRVKQHHYYQTLREKLKWNQ